jgi:cation:H+ antiporter
LDILLVVAGFVLLIGGGDVLVRGAVSIARRLDISPMIIGLTLVGFGTSTPELLTSVQAAVAGSPGIAVGNVVGSNIANILLILGIAALLRPMAVYATALWRDGTVMMAATALAVGMILWGELSRVSGLVLMTSLAVYLAVTIHRERAASTGAGDVYAAEAAMVPAVSGNLVRDLVMLLGGLALTLVAARLLVEGAISIAAGLGVSEAVIGLTIVAVGTSLPELVTSVVAAWKGESDVAVGNIIGSNIFNILGILGVTALVHPIAVPDQIAGLDIWVMAGATLAMIGLAATGSRITRCEGGFLLAGYITYLTVLLVTTLQ